MSETPHIFGVKDFVDVTYVPELSAVRLKYSSLYDELGINIPKAVAAAATYAKKHGIKNWIADTTLPTDDLSEKDSAWVGSQDFRDILLKSPIEKFVLVPPLPETGQDTSWIPDWWAATQAGFGEKITVKVLGDTGEIRDFLAQGA